MFERFTNRARRVVIFAQEEAKDLNHNYIGTEHILLGLIHEGDGIAVRALLGLGIGLDSVRTQIEDIVGRGSQPPSGHIPFTPRGKKVLELALREALQLGHNYIGTEHILLGLVREGEGIAAQVLVKLGVDLGRVRQAVIQEIVDSAELYRSPVREDAAYGLFEIAAEPSPEDKGVRVVKLDAVVLERFDPKGHGKRLRRVIKRYNQALKDMMAVEADIRRMRDLESR